MIKTRKNFTLIELLIVISIIAILASILLPALLQAKLASQSVACKNNIKQLSIITFNYTDDNNEYVMPARFKSNPALGFWPEILIKRGYVKKTGIVAAWGTQTNVLFHCPSKDENESDYYGVNVECAGRSGVSGAWPNDGGWQNGILHRLSYFKKHSKAMFFSDWRQSVVWENKWGPTLEDGLKSVDRHKLKYNVGHLDAHVNSYSFYDIPRTYNDPFWNGL